MVDDKKEKSKHKMIREKALEILKKYPDGIRYSDLVKTLQKFYPQIKVNTIRGSIWNLDEIYPDLVSKPSKGLFKLKDYEEFIQKENSKHKMIREKALEILKKYPDGIRYSDLIKTLQKFYPQIKVNTIRGSIWNLDEIYPDLVSKPKRGIFKLKEAREEDFYQKFADFLMKKDICTRCKPYGSSRQGNKWENPDVIGIFKNDINQEPIFIAGELKISSDWKDIIQGLGQALSYLLFTHKTILAIPKNINREDQRKMESLSANIQIGLVLFDSTNPNNPEFEMAIDSIKEYNPDHRVFSERKQEILKYLEH